MWFQETEMDRRVRAVEKEVLAEHGVTLTPAPWGGHHRELYRSDLDHSDV